MASTVTPWKCRCSSGRGGPIAGRRAAQSAPGHVCGHLTVACRVPGCRSVWYDPPHEPGTAL